MQQLSGLDTIFLRFERGNNYLHVGPVLFYEPAKGGSGAADFKTIVSILEERLSHLDIFRRKLLEVPWNLDDPYWVEDQDFDIRNHVQRTRLRKPGNSRQLCKEIARMHSSPLDRTRPLWLAHVIYGLDDIAGLRPGSFAIYVKTHHAIMDGTTGVGSVEAMHSAEPPTTGDASTDHSDAELEPPVAKLLSQALVNNIRQPLKLAGVVGQAAAGIRRIVNGTREDRFSSLGWRERTRFNGTVGPDRVCGYVKLSLGEIKQMRTLVPDATINDVTLAIVSGALRKYLQAKGEIPEKSLVAAAPVNVRTQQQEGSGGNVLSMITASLCTDIEDPLERLGCVQRETLAAKAYHDALGPGLLTSLGNSLSPPLVALCSGPLAATGLFARTPPLVNTIVSNVPGPRTPLHLGGAEMSMIVGVGPCVDGIGLFHTVSSYCDVITIGFQACAEMLPDPEFYTRCIEESVDELQAAL